MNRQCSWCSSRLIPSFLLLLFAFVSGPALGEVRLLLRLNSEAEFVEEALKKVGATIEYIDVAGTASIRIPEASVPILNSLRLFVSPHESRGCDTGPLMMYVEPPPSANVVSFIESIGGSPLSDVAFGTNFWIPLDGITDLQNHPEVDLLLLIWTDRSSNPFLIKPVLPLGPCHRFTARMSFSVPGEPSRDAEVAELSESSGGFYFFDFDNFEVNLKVLDGCKINGHWWVFAAGLTDLESTLTVFDSVEPTAPLSRVYTNNAGTPFELIRDVTAFPCTAGEL